MQEQVLCFICWFSEPLARFLLGGGELASTLRPHQFRWLTLAVPPRDLNDLPEG